MKIVIQTLDFVLWEELELFIAESLKQLLRYSVPLVRAEVILGEDNNDSSRARFCNIRLITAGEGYLVSQHAATWEQVVEAAVAELAKKLKKDIRSSLP